MKTELSLSDEWETPQELYDHLCYKYAVFPELDVACTVENKKCKDMLDDSLNKNWLYWDHQFRDIWCNPPHSETEKWVRKACEEWRKLNQNIMMILPANSLCTNYAEECIEPHAETHPINRKYCKFLLDGEERDSSRNGYFVVIWRKI